MSDFFPNDYPDFQEFGNTPCSESDPDAFFSTEPAEGSMRGFYPMEREAKAVCAACPYAARCLQYALEHSELSGIWGGTTEYQRRMMRKNKLTSIDIGPSRKR